MPFIQVQHYTGDADEYDLTQRPLLKIGSHRSNDIVISENGIEILHCQISRSQNGYHVFAAGMAPLLINKKELQQHTFQDGDELQIGSIKIRYLEKLPEAPEKTARHEGLPVTISDESEDERMLSLKPLSGEIPATPATPPKSPQKPAPQPPKTRTPQKARESSESLSSADTHEISGSSAPRDISAALDALAAESRTASQESSRRKGQQNSPDKKQTPAAQPRRPSSEVKIPVRRDLPSTDSVPAYHPNATPKQIIKETGRLTPVSVRERDSGSEIRNQPRDTGKMLHSSAQILRSRWVWGAGGAGLMMFLIAWTLLSSLGGQAEQQVDTARQFFFEGDYAASAETYQKFLAKYPEHPLAAEADRWMILAQAGQSLRKERLNLKEGLQHLQHLVSDHSNSPEFDEIRNHASILAKTVAQSAAEAAGHQHRHDLLEVSQQAKLLVEQIVPADTAKREFLNQLEQKIRSSSIAIDRYHVTESALTSIADAVQKQAPLEALKLRREFLLKDPEKSNDPQILQFTSDAISQELKTVQKIDQQTQATFEDHAWPTHILTLGSHGQARADLEITGQIALLVTQDSCFGIDPENGKPIWRRTTGAGMPFFPVSVGGDLASSVILFDTQHQELVRISRQTGEFEWRLPLNETVQGFPLVTEQRIYVTSPSGQLSAVDLLTGSLEGAIRFSQPIAGLVRIAGTNTLLVAGQAEVLYRIPEQTLTCDAVFPSGHSDGSIQSPLLSAASYFLFVENGAESATLKIFESDKAVRRVQLLATASVPGQVIDPPVLRGRNLFVPSTRERISTFTLTDEPDQPPLTVGPVYQAEPRFAGPIFLLTAPDQQLWMATRQLSRLQLTATAIQPDGGTYGTGAAMQPLQSSSGGLLFGRKRPYANVNTLSRTNIEDGTGDWQIMLGGKVLAMSQPSVGSDHFIAVTESGQIFRISSSQFESHRFVIEPSSQIPIPSDLTEPLIASRLSDNRLTIVRAGQKPMLFIINQSGQIDASHPLPASALAAACLSGNKIAVLVESGIFSITPQGETSLTPLTASADNISEWKAIYSVVPDSVVGVSDDGHVLHFSLNADDADLTTQNHLIQLQQQISADIQQEDNFCSIVDDSHRVTLLTLEPLAVHSSREFASALTSPGFLVGDRLYVAEQETLHCFETDQQMSPNWSTQLSRQQVCQILDNGKHLIVLQKEGLVSELDPETGNVIHQHSLLNAVSETAEILNDRLIISTTDGSLIRLELPLSE